jgi:hypothetical protein
MPTINHVYKSVTYQGIVVLFVSILPVGLTDWYVHACAVCINHSKESRDESYSQPYITNKINNE